MIAGFVLALLIVSAPDVESAEALAARGFESFQAKQFDRAADFFLRAYSLSGEATALRNAARALEEANETEQAILRWKEYRALPQISAEDRREAEEHLAALKPPPKSEPKPLPKLEPAPPPPISIKADPPPETSKPLPYWVGGAGVAGLIAGVITYGVGRSALSSLEDRLAIVDSSGRITGIDRDEAISERDRSDTLRTGGAVLCVAGAAAILTGVAWWWFDRDPGDGR